MKKYSYLALAIGASMASSAALAAPGKPNISWMPSTQESGSNISVKWNMWWGSNGSRWQLTDGSEVLCAHDLSDNSPQAQSGKLHC